MDHEQKNDKAERARALGRTTEERGKGNQMTALRFQTGERHPTSQAPLRWGIFLTSTEVVTAPFDCNIAGAA